MNGTRLSLFDPVRRYIERTRLTGGNKWAAAVLAGGLCGAAGGVVGSPVVMVKVRQQSYMRESARIRLSSAESARVVGAQHEYVNRGFVRALAHIGRNEGIRGLWRGVDSGIIRFATGSSIQLSTFSTLRPHVRRRLPASTPQYVVDAISAGCAQVAVVSVIDPVDVVYSRMLNQSRSPAILSSTTAPSTSASHSVPVSQQAASPAPLHYRSSLHCLVTTIRNEGVTALYKGYIPHLARAGPQGVITLVGVEGLKRWTGESGREKG
ncbi:Mitochondrial oxaloacetate carrier protein [Gonapodya sp. JEL0774]|nr:Mitochondrial oxaloacetate carrier protein [Gonapodya sp. JEL0774]